MNLNERIRARREQLGLTQEELAKLTGYTSRSMINKIESGVRDINQSQIIVFAKALQTTPADLMGWEGSTPQTGKGIKIPVLGKISAGLPNEAVQNIIDYEEIDRELAITGDFFALQVQGNSMAPRVIDGDVVIVRKQAHADSGSVVVAMVNGENATVKQFRQERGGIALIPYNPTYDTLRFSNEEVEKLPILIIGVVVELRGKFGKV